MTKVRNFDVDSVGQYRNLDDIPVLEICFCSCLGIMCQKVIVIEFFLFRNVRMAFLVSVRHEHWVLA